MAKQEFVRGEKVLLSVSYGLGEPRYGFAHYNGHSERGGYIHVIGQNGQALSYPSVMVQKLSFPVLISKDGATICEEGASEPWGPFFETLEYESREFADDPGLAERLWGRTLDAIERQAGEVDYLYMQAADFKARAKRAEQHLEDLRADLKKLEAIVDPSGRDFEVYHVVEPRGE